jgi:hypothetical protein
MSTIEPTYDDPTVGGEAVARPDAASAALETVADDAPRAHEVRQLADPPIPADWPEFEPRVPPLRELH